MGEGAVSNKSRWSELSGPLGAAMSVMVVFIAVLAIPLNAAPDLGLSPGETAGWIVAVYGVASLLGLILTLVYRQPLLMTGNVFIMIFVSGLAGDFVWAELVGASIVAGGVVLILGVLGLTKKLASLLPAPIVFGLLAGAVLPFFVDMFTELGEEPLLVGGTLAVYLVARLTVEPKVPAILPALVAAFLIAGLSGDFDGVPIVAGVVSPTFTAPVFSLGAILTVTPVMVVLITVQANAPSVVFLREQEFQPPVDVVNTVSGLGTIGGSILGPTGVSLSLPATALIAGADAGPHLKRYLSSTIVSVFGLVIAALAGVAVLIAEAIPSALLVTGVGLAVIGVLSTALNRITQGPMMWGPLFAFGISLSELSLLGLGPFFWAIAGGLIISLILERDEWKALREGSDALNATRPATARKRTP